jgi:hypothetical protein
MRCQITVGTLLLLLCGCAGSPAGTSSDRPSATTSATTTTAPTTTTTPPFEPLTTDPQDCFDGICTIRVSKGTEFPLDADAFGLIGFAATVVSRDAFECQLYDRSGGAFTLTLKKPGDSAAGQLNVPTWVTLVSIDTKTAVIAIGHTEPP